MMRAVLLSLFDVVLPDSPLGTDLATWLRLTNNEDAHGLLKRAAHACIDASCVENVADSPDATQFWIMALGLASTLVLSAVGCVAWETCRRKLRRADAEEQTPQADVATETSDPKMATPVSRVSTDSLTIDAHEGRYFEKGYDNGGNEMLDVSIEPSNYENPALLYTPYRLAWTTPNAVKHVENVNQQDGCSCTTVNVSETHSQNPQPECDQKTTSPASRLQDELSISASNPNRRHGLGSSPASRPQDEHSIAASTPNHTPGLGYARGRPTPTPLERLNSVASPMSASGVKLINQTQTEYPLSPQTLFLEKRRHSRQSSMHRLLDLQAHVIKLSDDSVSCRLEDSLQWDSFPFRSREESLVWEDFMMETFNVDENGNDPSFSVVAELA